MSPERWKKLEAIYHAALPLAQRERVTLLARICAGDDRLRHEVETLLAANDPDFLQSGVATLGWQVLADAETQRMTMNTPTQKINDRYELLRELGGGGMGKVYQARDTHVGGRPVVVKLLQEKWLQHEWVVTKFKQEATALARIDDPGVVGILDAGVLPDGQPWLVLQFVEGQELKEHIRSGGMELADVAEIVKQIGRTLTTAHDASVIHRDLKPANIMVRRNTSGDWQVKVIDFGIAKVLDDVSDDAGQAATRFQVGTPLYMSPEQRKVQPLTPASDVYALGLIAYEMLTGARPFNPADPQELAALQQSGLKVKPSDLRPGLAKAVDDALSAALAYDTHKRPASARAFCDALAQALTHQPPPPRMSRRWLAAAATIVFVIAITGSIWREVAKQTSSGPEARNSQIANSLMNQATDVGTTSKQESKSTRCSKIYLTRSVTLAEKPDYGSFTGLSYVAGTEFECLRIQTNGFVLVKDGSGNERWIRPDAASGQDPRTYFRILGTQLKGYLVGTMFEDKSGGNTSQVNINDKLLGLVVIPIKQIKSIRVNSNDRAAPLSLTTFDGQTYSGVSKITPPYVGASHHTYLVQGEALILLESSENLALEVMSVR